VLPKRSSKAEPADAPPPNPGDTIDDYGYVDYAAPNTSKRLSRLPPPGIGVGY
jgi:hypothetical protein